MVQALATMASEGTQLVLGTDWCPCSASLGTALEHPAFKAGAATLTEMRILAEGGMTNEAIIAAATVNAARALGLSELGTLKPGKLADLIVIDGNPLEDITALQNVRTVVKGGIVVVRH
jgi:imidazolonepropionase-like amidohydrolase